MGEINKYQTYIEDILSQYAQYTPAYGDIEMQTVIDRERNHYQLMTVGWNKYHRIRGCVIHVDIKNNKIWIQHDGTKHGIANEFVEKGVPKDDIVLAFHPPYKRQYTGFAVD
jgi:hypothetical protein